jgi:hypothetical protein
LSLAGVVEIARPREELEPPLPQRPIPSVAVANEAVVETESVLV